MDATISASTYVVLFAPMGLILTLVVAGWITRHRSR